MRPSFPSRGPYVLWEGVLSGIIVLREPFGVIDNGGNGGGCGHQSTLPSGPADGKHARGSFWSAHARGLKRFCSGQGSGAQAYGYIPRLADAAMDKIGDRKSTRLNSSH